MTMITYQVGDRSRFRPSPFAPLFNPARSAVLKLRDGWRRRQTERMLESLPAEIRKDIGWPTTNAPAGRK
ncbi:hypothetical protein ACFFP0_00445 [Rhizobium puerariae]|uniref:DUF1127 domain-containing protein n=1 Tax=Rhizobium puerariae TaxID=1585791 RepID=A0ABV6AD68_9HYPH